MRAANQTQTICLCHCGGLLTTTADCFFELDNDQLAHIDRYIPRLGTDFVAAARALLTDAICVSFRSPFPLTI